MAKKCLACGAPLDGIFAKVAALAGVKPSEKNPDYCNKCEHQIPKSPAPEPEKPPEPKDIYESAAESTVEVTGAPVPADAQPVVSAPESLKPPEPEIKLNTEDPVDMFAATDKKE